MTAYGPGVALLATLSGNDAEEIATRPAVALRALADLTKDLAHLAADTTSPDPEVRAAAERRAAEIKALVEASRPPDTGPAKERLKARVEDALAALLRER